MLSVYLWPKGITLSGFHCTWIAFSTKFSYSIKNFLIFSAGSSGASSGQAGAVDEDLFLQSFEDVKPITFHSSRSLQVSLITKHLRLKYPYKIKFQTNHIPFKSISSGQFDE